MVRFEYRDLSGGEDIDPDAATYSIIELNREHLVRYVLKTSKGNIILRHIPLRMKRIIDSARYHIYPTAREMEQELQELRPYFDGIPIEDVDPEAKDRVQELYEQLRLTDMYALGVIVAPALACMDDYEQLFEMLNEAERAQLAAAVRELATVCPVNRVDSTADEIARSNGLRIMDPDMLEMMTVSQANFYLDRIRQENRNIERMMGRKG